MSFDLPLLVTFVAYLLLILYLGIKAYQRTHNLGDYILGGRKLGSVVTALSVGASDMSGWLLLGLPGAIYLAGISEIWIGIGLVIGAYCNWLSVVKPPQGYTASMQTNHEHCPIFMRTDLMIRAGRCICYPWLSSCCCFFVLYSRWIGRWDKFVWE